MIQHIVAAFCVGFFMLIGLFLQLLLLIGLNQEPTKLRFYPKEVWIVMLLLSTINLTLIYSFFHVVSLFLE